MAEANDGAGIKPVARHPNDRLRNAPRLTMAQAVAAKWIARYAGDDACAVSYRVVTADTACR